MTWMSALAQRGTQRYADRVAIIDGDKRLSYAELYRRSAGLAAHLNDRGIGLGQRVAVLSHNRCEVLETYIALGLMGATAVPLHYGTPPAEAGAVVEKLGASALIGTDHLVARLAGQLRIPVLAFEQEEYRSAVEHGGPAPELAVAQDQPLFLLPTGGTTGQAKIVPLTQRALRAVTIGYLAEVRPPEQLVFLHCGPLSHGAVVLPLAYLAAGATVVLMSVFTPPGCLATIATYEVTHMFLVPEMLRLLLRTPGIARARPGSLREIVYAAAPMPRPLLLAARAELGCEFRQVYGITEGGGPVAMLAPAEHDYRTEPVSGAAASVGRVILGTGIRSCDEGGHPLAAGQLGELWICGDGAATGYWRDPEETRQAVRDGWVRTGDIGSVDEQGYVYLAGRVKEVISRAGQKIFPAEVEDVLVEHPAVAEAAVIGVLDEVWGQLPVAYVVIKPGSAVDAGRLRAELRRHCANRLGNYKRPARIEIIDSLPRSAAGKLLRRALPR